MAVVAAYRDLLRRITAYPIDPIYPSQPTAAYHSLSRLFYPVYSILLALEATTATKATE